MKAYLLIEIGKDDKVIVPKRNIDFIQMIADGFSRKDVAEKYELSIRTIEDYLSDLAKLFKANDQTHLVAILLREQIIK